MPYREIFKDSKTDKSFKKNGYALVTLVPEQKAQELLTFYQKNPTPVEGGFHSTHFSKNRAYKKLVQDKIIETFNTELNGLIDNYLPIFGNFMVKEASEMSIMPLHADWTYVDEDKFISLGIWIPLVHTTSENGMLGVVPKSHFLKKNLRGPKFPTPFHDFNEYIIDNYGKLIPMKAGQAVIYDHRLLHYSPPNISKKPRVAVNLVMVPEEADVVHYTVQDNPDEYHTYYVKQRNFFLEYDHFETPDNGSQTETSPLNIQHFEQNYIDEILSESNLLDKIKKLFVKSA